MQVKNSLAITPTQVYKFWNASWRVFIISPNLLTHNTLWAWISPHFSEPSQPSLKWLLALYSNAQLSMILWTSISSLTFHAFREKRLGYQRATKWVRKYRHSQFKSLRSIFPLKARGTIPKSLPKENYSQYSIRSLHPFFYRSKAAAVRGSVPLLDPVRRYKDTNFYDYYSPFLRTQNPIQLKRKRGVTRLPSKRLRLLKKLLIKDRPLKVYTQISTSRIGRKNEPTHPFTFIASRSALRLLRSERRLYIRMLPQMRISVETLKSLRDGDVRHFVVKRCYMRYRRHQAPTHRGIGTTQPRTRGQSKINNKRVFYYGRVRRFEHIVKTSRSNTSAPNPFSVILADPMRVQFTPTRGGVKKLSQFITTQTLQRPLHVKYRTPHLTYSLVERLKKLHKPNPNLRTIRETPLNPVKSKRFRSKNNKLNLLWSVRLPKQSRIIKKFVTKSRLNRTLSDNPFLAVPPVQQKKTRISLANPNVPLVTRVSRRRRAIRSARNLIRRKSKGKYRLNRTNLAVARRKFLRTIELFNDQRDMTRSLWVSPHFTNPYRSYYFYTLYRRLGFKHRSGSNHPYLAAKVFKKFATHSRSAPTSLTPSREYFNNLTGSSTITSTTPLRLNSHQLLKRRIRRQGSKIRVSLGLKKLRGKAVTSRNRLWFKWVNQLLQGHKKVTRRKFHIHMIVLRRRHVRKWKYKQLRRAVKAYYFTMTRRWAHRLKNKNFKLRRYNIRFFKFKRRYLTIRQLQMWRAWQRDRQAMSNKLPSVVLKTTQKGAFMLKRHIYNRQQLRSKLPRKLFNRSIHTNTFKLAPSLFNESPASWLQPCSDHPVFKLSRSTSLDQNRLKRKFYKLAPQKLTIRQRQLRRLKSQRLKFQKLKHQKQRGRQKPLKTKAYGQRKLSFNKISKRHLERKVTHGVRSTTQLKSVKLLAHTSYIYRGSAPARFMFTRREKQLLNNLPSQFTSRLVSRQFNERYKWHFSHKKLSENCRFSRLKNAFKPLKLPKKRREDRPKQLLLNRVGLFLSRKLRNSKPSLFRIAAVLVWRAFSRSRKDRYWWDRRFIRRRGRATRLWFQLNYRLLGQVFYKWVRSNLNQSLHLVKTQRSYVTSQTKHLTGLLNRYNRITSYIYRHESLNQPSPTFVLTHHYDTRVQRPDKPVLLAPSYSFRGSRPKFTHTLPVQRLKANPDSKFLQTVLLRYLACNDSEETTPQITQKLTRNNKYPNLRKWFDPLLLKLSTKRLTIRPSHRFKEIMLTTKHTNPFILAPYGFMYIFNVNKDLLNNSIWKSRLNKTLYSFADLLDVKRYILRRFTKSLNLSSATSPRVNTFLTTQRVTFLNNPLRTGAAVDSPLGGSNWISPSYDRLSSHNLNFDARSTPTSLVNYNVRIRRIRFKPGYSRIWRSARTSFKQLVGLNFRYQKKLTIYLLRFFRIRQNFSFTYENLKLGKVLERVHFSNDFLSSKALIEWQAVYLNGYVVENSGVVLFVNDFIQMIVHLKYYITYRWLGHWVLKKRNRIFKLKKLKWKPTSFRLDKQRSYSLPNWLLGYKTINFDVPKYLEIDYMTLSVFVIYEPFMYSDFYFSPELIPRSQVLNMYNWKYIT